MTRSIVALAVLNVLLLVAAVFAIWSAFEEGSQGFSLGAHAFVGSLPGGNELPTMDKCQNALQLKKEYSRAPGDELLLLPTAETQIAQYC
jgi:hypothetical protein